jgi:pyruvate,orthophosphate dikinase
MTGKKHVYYFGGKKAEGDRTMKKLLGGKGANLHEMVNMGIPVPPGFTITTETCTVHAQTNGQLTEDIHRQIREAIQTVEREVGRKFGDPNMPLLLSVRSGAEVSMPGMMDTVLNLGLNDASVVGFAKSTDNERFVWDCYRRFIAMYSDVVRGIKKPPFEHVLTAARKRIGAAQDCDLTVDELKRVVTEYKAIYRQETGEDFPMDPMTQLRAATDAVFKSWFNERAETYRRMFHITGLLGTAVNVQAMVFGNMSNDSATGVCFSRNPANGDPGFYGEYLINAQGEDVVAGIRTPQQMRVETSKQWAKDHGVAEVVRSRDFPSMEESMPDNYKFLVEIRNKLEKHFKDMQDMEFTIERGRLWLLQTRNGKRTMLAATRIAVQMVNEKLITEKEAVMRIDPNSIDQLLHPGLDTTAKLPPKIAKGLPASPGARVGQIVFCPKVAVQWHAEKKDVILVREETSPEDLSGMSAAQGILTSRGGVTSHAAVVARGMGKTCVCGCGDLHIDYKTNTMTIKGKTYRQGDWITIDGTKGDVYEGKAKLTPAGVQGDFEKILGYAKKYKSMGVRANADSPNDAKTSFKFGAEGIGLCRTEHMFFEADRIDAVREMILATTEEGRKVALTKILPYQRDDFIGIFRAMQGLPCTIRLLDPPLHEFLPHDDENQTALAKKMGVDPKVVADRVKALHEFNPMLGHRGVRLGITYPEIYNTQVQAIMEAAVEVKRTGLNVEPEIMIPIVGKIDELTFSREQCEQVCKAVLKSANVSINYSVGTMIEVPRAAVTADQIARDADFFSFGTNDLTQMGCGFSRDDSGSFLNHYVKMGIYKKDPFMSIDQEGVGELVRIAVTKGRSVKPSLKMGVCGEHGGDPDSIEFFHKVGLSYVSCSPYRVPAAIIAAARAAIQHGPQLKSGTDTVKKSKL